MKFFELQVIPLQVQTFFEFRLLVSQSMYRSDEEARSFQTCSQKSSNCSTTALNDWFEAWLSRRFLSTSHYLLIVLTVGQTDRTRQDGLWLSRRIASSRLTFERYQSCSKIRIGSVWS